MSRALNKNCFWVLKNAASYHPGPVTPSTAGGAKLLPRIRMHKYFQGELNGDILVLLNTPKIHKAAPLAKVLPNVDGFRKPFEEDTLNVRCLNFWAVSRGDR